MQNRLLPFLASAVTIAAGLTAQNCTDNQYRLWLVDRFGAPVGTQFDPVANGPVHVFADEGVYLAFDPALPSGVYYVHVTDLIAGADEVRSANDPLDRFVQVTNNAGVITLSFPQSQSPQPPVLGAGLNGVGQSLLLNPLRSTTEARCHFKAWYGDAYGANPDPNNPYLLNGGWDPVLQVCRVRSYETFRIGDGNGSEVSGVVFHDADRDGVRDLGEAGVAGATVVMDDGAVLRTAVTDATGFYRFPGTAAGSYLVRYTLPGGFTASTPTSYSITVCGCGPTVGGDFGQYQQVQRCDGHTIGFWGNRNGLALVTQYGILAQLPALCLVDARGQRVAPATTAEFSSWLRGAKSTNMAYMLSAQLAAMWSSVAVGNVSGDCMIRDCRLGRIAIRDLMARAIASLCAHPYTPSGHPQRAAQEALKNALDAANNNANWVR